MAFRTAAAALVALGLFATPLPTADAFGNAQAGRESSAHAQLMSELARFAKMTDGTVGIAVRNMSTGEAIDMNGDTLFPMASAYKVAVAGTIFSMIDKGQLTLQQQVDLDPKLLTDDGIADMFPHPGAALSLYNLLDLMLTRSDNSATDMLVAQAGGAQAVDAWVKTTGVKGLRVDSNTAGLLYRAMGISGGSGNFRQTVMAALEADGALRERDARDLPNLAFAQDPRDTSTPHAMNDLLIAIRTGRVLKPQSVSIMMAIMERCRTGAGRIKGMLPPGTVVAHKTGSLNGTGNDVGFFTLPNGQMVAISLFVMKDFKGRETRDRIMAETSRAAYDYFLFSRTSRQQIRYDVWIE